MDWLRATIRINCFFFRWFSGKTTIGNDGFWWFAPLVRRWNGYVPSLKSRWRTDEEPMKIRWWADDELVKSWQMADEELIKSCWRADEELMKSWSGLVRANEIIFDLIGMIWIMFIWTNYSLGCSRWLSQGFLTYNLIKWYQRCHSSSLSGQSTQQLPFSM